MIGLIFARISYSLSIRSVNGILRELPNYSAVSICRCDCHSNCRVLVLGSLSRRFHKTLILTLEWILIAINCRSVLGVLRAGGQWVATQKKSECETKHGIVG